MRRRQEGEKGGGPGMRRENRQKCESQHQSLWKPRAPPEQPMWFQISSQKFQAFKAKEIPSNIPRFPIIENLIYSNAQKPSFSIFTFFFHHRSFFLFIKNSVWLRWDLHDRSREESSARKSFASADSMLNNKKRYHQIKA